MLLRFPPPVIEDDSVKNGRKQQACCHKQNLRILVHEKESTIIADDRREEQFKLGGVTESSCRIESTTTSVIVNRLVLVTVVFLLQFGGIAVHASSRSNVDQVFGLQSDHRRAPPLPSGRRGGGQSPRGNPIHKNHAIQEILGTFLSPWAADWLVKGWLATCTSCQELNFARLVGQGSKKFGALSFPMPKMVQELWVPPCLGLDFQSGTNLGEKAQLS